MKDVIAGALELQAFCLEQQWRFCFIGGLAVQRWGEPRFTHDADLTLLCGFGGEQRFVELILKRFSARSPGELAFALRSRVVRVFASTRYLWISRWALSLSRSARLHALPHGQGRSTKEASLRAVPRT